MKSFDEFLLQAGSSYDLIESQISDIASNYNGFRGSPSDVVQELAKMTLEMAAVQTVELLRSYHEWLTQQLDA